MDDNENRNDGKRHYGPHGFGCNCPRVEQKRTGDLTADMAAFAITIAALDPLIDSLARQYPNGFTALTN